MQNSVVGTKTWTYPSENASTGAISFRIFLFRSFHGTFHARAGEGSLKWIYENGRLLSFDEAKLFFPFLSWKNYEFPNLRC